MRIIKQAGFYAGTLIVALAGIVAVIQLGGSLPAPSMSGAAVEVSQYSMLQGLMHALAVNLRHPLSHLFGCSDRDTGSLERDIDALGLIGEKVLIAKPSRDQTTRT